MKTKLRKVSGIVFFITLLVFSANVRAQMYYAGEYRTVFTFSASNWSNIGTWEVYDGMYWNPATQLPNINTPTIYITYPVNVDGDPANSGPSYSASHIEIINTTLTINEQVTFTLAGGFMAPNSICNGNIINYGTFIINTNLDLIPYDEFNKSIYNYGIMEVSSSKDLYLGGTFIGFNPTITSLVNSSTGILNVYGTIGTIGSIINSNEINVYAGGVLATGFNSINNKNITIDSGGTMVINHDLAEGLSGNNIINKGNLNIYSGGITTLTRYINSGIINNQGTLTLEGYSNTGTIINSNSAILDLNTDITNSGIFENYGEVYTNAPHTISLDMENNGVFSIGSSLTLNSDFENKGRFNVYSTRSSPPTGGTLILDSGSFNNQEATSANIQYVMEEGKHSAFNGTLAYKGNSKIAGDEFKSEIPALYIDLANEGNTLSLTESKAVTTSLNLSKGIVLFSGENDALTLGNEDEPNVSFSRISGWTNGIFRWYVNKDNKWDTLIFPVGTSTSFREFKFNIDQSYSFTSSGYLGVKYAEGDPGGFTGYLPNPKEDGALVTKYWNQGYWRISPEYGLVIGPDASYTVKLSTQGLTGTYEYDKLRVMTKDQMPGNEGQYGYIGEEWSVELQQWVPVRLLYGNHFHQSNDYVMRYNLKKFYDFSGTSIFAIGSNSDNDPLPVIMSSFTSTVNNRNARLSWITQSEHNNKGFEIERKISGNGNIEYVKIGFVNGQGNSPAQQVYSFEDKNLATGKYSYRIRQIDFNGNQTYYNLANEIEIGIPSKYELSQNYPNPFNPVTKIDFQIPLDGTVSLTVYDASGREVKRIINNEMKKADYHTVEFYASGLSSGIYFYKLSSSSFNITKKMVLVK